MKRLALCLALIVLVGCPNNSSSSPSTTTHAAGDGHDHKGDAKGHTEGDGHDHGAHTTETKKGN